jgi:hypothetical protein
MIMPKHGIHWPWAPVIIGSGLISLSILMRLYEFESSFVNLVASAGDIVVIFSLLYIIKIFLIEETPILAPQSATVARFGLPGIATQAQSRTSEVRYDTTQHAADTGLVADMTFQVISVDERTSIITAQAHVDTSVTAHISPKQAVLDIMKQQGALRNRVREWGNERHGPDFRVASVNDVTVRRSVDGGIDVIVTYTLGSGT